MLASACLLLLMRMIVILMLAMSTKFHRLMTFLTVFLLLPEAFRAPWLFIRVHSCCSCQLGSGRASSFSKCGLIVRRHGMKMLDKLRESLAFAKCSLGNAI